MIAAQAELIRQEIEEGTGAEIGLSIDDSGLLSAMRIRFADLDERHGPVAELRPRAASSSCHARLRRLRRRDFAADLAGLWLVRDGTFRIVATIRHPETSDPETSVSRTCREVIVPLMAAMAELIGYDVVEDDPEKAEVPAFEGAILESVVRRRERHPRNRLLCIRLHGEKCRACGLEPKLRYGDLAGAIIEVHHLEALSLLAEPRPYDPVADLVPLCPNCHRAVHTRRPVPLPVEKLKSLLEMGDG